MAQCPACGVVVPPPAPSPGDGPAGQFAALPDEPCPNCGAPLPRPPAVPWYFHPGSLVVAFLVVGPFMLPLLWWHPTIGRGWKIAWTVAALAFTALLTWASIKSLVKIWELFRQLDELY